MRRWAAKSASLAVAMAAVVVVVPAAVAQADEPPPFVPGEVLVLYEGERAEQVVDLPPDIGVIEAVERLSRKPDVAYAAPNYIATASLIPNDPGIGPGGPRDWVDDQWNFLRPFGVRATTAWDHLIAAGSPGAMGITIAVVDSGLTPNADLQPAIVSPHDYVDDDLDPQDASGHGTHVASTIAQTTDNSLGVTGLAYSATLMPVRVLNANDAGTSANVARGIKWAAAHGAEVVNLSFEFPRRIDGCDEIRGVCRAIKRAREAGAVIVAAAGNKHQGRIAYPAAAKGVIGVGATTARGCLAEYSNHGNRLDLVAPGGGSDRRGAGDRCRPRAGAIPITQYSGKMTGTSMAAAHVSGVTALLLASDAPGRGEPAARLRCTAKRLGPRSLYAAGLANAAKATDPDRAC